MHRSFRAALLLVAGLVIVPGFARAQDEAPTQAGDSTGTASPADTSENFNISKYDNLYAGQFTPGAGFDLIRTKRGSVNVSVYGLFRYINQGPPNQTFTDHLGRVRKVSTRNDLQWQRSFIWITGFFFDPRFRYNVSAWSLLSTQQTLIFGNLRYLLSEKLTFGVGMGPNLTNRSLQGSWPFWAATDRQMAEEFLRGGFASSFWITGKPVGNLYYTGAVNTAISQLGVTAANDSRDFAYSGSIWWLPTTGEFGPRKGFGDLEYHKAVATQFGLSAATSRESRYANLNDPPNATQLRLSDGVNPFEAGALADSSTVTRLRYRDFSFDAGAKYRGFALQAEYTYRVLSNFETTAPIPDNQIIDRGFFAEAMHMVVPQHLGLYVVTSQIYDQFKRRPWEFAYGATYYPYGNRNWRLNLHIIRIEKSPTGSTFGYYTAGQSGTTFSLATDILL